MDSRSRPLAVVETELTAFVPALLAKAFGEL